MKSTSTVIILSFFLLLICCKKTPSNLAKETTTVSQTKVTEQQTASRFTETEKTTDFDSTTISCVITLFKQKGTLHNGIYEYKINKDCSAYTDRSSTNTFIVNLFGHNFLVKKGKIYAPIKVNNRELIYIKQVIRELLP